jgi:hypothetical protein
MNGRLISRLVLAWQAGDSFAPCFVLSAFGTAGLRGSSTGSSASPGIPLPGAWIAASPGSVVKSDQLWPVCGGQAGDRCHGEGPSVGSEIGRVGARLPVDGAVMHLISQQNPLGCWEGEVAWNTMLLSQYVLTCRMVGRWPLSPRDQRGVLHHFEVSRRPDGSWPLHGEGPGSVFVTSLAYVAIRLLGQPASAPLTAAARGWLRAQQDGVAVMPSWGRMWLAMLGLYEYEGINPIPPETLLLPRWALAHPDRLYVHTRLIYVGLACLFAVRPGSTSASSPGSCAANCTTSPMSL